MVPVGVVPVAVVPVGVVPVAVVPVGLVPVVEVEPVVEVLPVLVVVVAPEVLAVVVVVVPATDAVTVGVDVVEALPSQLPTVVPAGGVPPESTGTTVEKASGTVRTGDSGTTMRWLSATRSSRVCTVTVPFLHQPVTTVAL